jgi:hypothetical protein
VDHKSSSTLIKCTICVKFNLLTSKRTCSKNLRLHSEEDLVWIEIFHRYVPVIRVL